MLDSYLNIRKWVSTCSLPMANDEFVFDFMYDNIFAFHKK